jgi:Uma2 family endonuclease
MALLAKSEQPLTGEQLAEMADLGPCELVDGRIVPMPPPGPLHATLESEVDWWLRSWAKQTRRGQVLVGEAGIFIRRNPDTVRGADVAYISNQRWARRGDSAYLEVAPELVVEIVSPNDRWVDIMDKLADYFEAGVERAWLVDPYKKKVFVYSGVTDVRIFQPGDNLTDDEILPGFSLPLDDLFAE